MKINREDKKWLKIYLVAVIVLVLLCLVVRREPAYQAVLGAILGGMGLIGVSLFIRPEGSDRSLAKILPASAWLALIGGWSGFVIAVVKLLFK